MKKTYALILLLLTQLATQAQCSFMGISVSSSDTSYVQLYHPGFFILPSGFANVCNWEITTFAGDIVHQETTGGSFEEAFMLFDHTVPITDSMVVTLVITNDSSGITCTVIDTLYWEESEVLPGAFIGNWAILGNNGGLQTGLADRTSAAAFTVFPSPVVDQLRITGAGNTFALAIHTMNGALLATRMNMRAGDFVDVSGLPSGVYAIRLWDEHNRPLGTRKFVKR